MFIGCTHKFVSNICLELLDPHGHLHFETLSASNQHVGCSTKWVSQACRVLLIPFDDSHPREEESGALLNSMCRNMI